MGMLWITDMWQCFDADLTVDLQGLTTPGDRVALITTGPLTDNEVWATIQPRELLVFQDGLPLPWVEGSHRG